MMLNREFLCNACSRVTATEQGGLAPQARGEMPCCTESVRLMSVDLQGAVDMDAVYEQQGIAPEAQPLPPGPHASLPYAAGLPAPLPLTFPPASSADVRPDAPLF